MSYLLLLITTASLLGCGDNALIVDMTAGDIEEYCQWATDLRSEDITEDCGGGTTTTLMSLTMESCTEMVELEIDILTDEGNDCATVSDMKSCAEAIVADPCDGTDSDACAPQYKGCG